MAWRRRASAAWLGAVAALATAALLAATNAQLGMVWDEAFTLRRDRLLADWATRAWAEGPPWRQALAKPTLDRWWPFSRAEPDGHPPFYAELGAAGWLATHRWLPGLAPYRAGPIAFWSAAVGIAAWLLARRHGCWAGAVAAFALAAQPHLFAHAHYAHYDAPMTALWLLGHLFFLEATRGGARWRVAFGIALGLGMATKFTGWFAVAAPLAWTLAREWRAGPRPGLRALLWGLPIAVAVLYAVQPAWWLRPLDGPWEFFASNLSRRKTTEVPVLYLGQVYAFALPWHNTLVYLTACVPASLLALAGYGWWQRLRTGGDGAVRGDAWLWLLSFGTLLAVRGLPNAPGHDGVRLFLPSLAAASVAAGLGVAALRRPVWRWAAAGLLAAECLHGVASVYPYCLSYHSVAIGGVRGAERLGLEVTYYWDTLAAELQAGLTELRDRTPDRRLEVMLPYRQVFLPYLLEFGYFPPGVAVQDFAPVTRPDYILQRRRGAYGPADWWLERHATPRLAIARGGVELLRVYSFEDTRRAFRETNTEPPPNWER